MEATKRTARLAGLLYVLLGASAIDLMYVPGKLIVRGNATLTAGNILAHEWLFRIGIVSSLFSSVVFIFLALVLYRLFKGVNRQHAFVLLILVLIQIPISFLNEVSSLAALLLVRGGDYLSIFAKPQRDALAMLFLNVHTQGILVCEIFWGLWLFPFGLLVFRSGFMPRILGIWLIINGFAYVIISLTGLLLPQYVNKVFNNAFPVLLGELAVMLWLLIIGIREKPAALTSSSAV